MEAAELALKTETDAVRFYTEAAEKTSHPVGKKLFLSIREDEKRHIAMIKDLLKGLDFKPGQTEPIANVKSVFEANKDEMMQRIGATSDEKQALETAMKMEFDGYELYKKIEAGAKDPKVKALFQRLLKEEEQHYMIFSNTYSFLEDTDNWFMWEEHSIVEGG